MANIYPIQHRTIDPFASYNSNCVNELTRMVSNGEDCIFGGPSSLQVEIDPAHPTILILRTGRCFKDDVIVEVTSDFTIDFFDPDFYFSVLPTMTGIYYVVLDYVYVKSKPAPQASVKILRPDQHGLFTDQFVFLKAVNIILNGASLEISEVFDCDPGDTSVKKNYPVQSAPLESTLPVWTTDDEGRIIYVADEGELYFGAASDWELVASTRETADTSGCTLGQLGYLHSDGTIHESIATSISTISECVVQVVDSTVGKVKLFGRAINVPFESGSNPARGDKLYLSQSQSGCVTENVPSSGIIQYVGVCATNNGDGTVNMWFTPGISYDLSLPVVYRDILSGADWILDTGNYRGTITHNIGHSNPYVVTCTDNGTNMIIQPSDIEFIDVNSFRVWMPVNSVSVGVVVIG